MTKVKFGLFVFFRKFLKKNSVSKISQTDCKSMLVAWYINKKLVKKFKICLWSGWSILICLLGFKSVKKQYFLQDLISEISMISMRHDTERPRQKEIEKETSRQTDRDLLTEMTLHQSNLLISNGYAEYYWAGAVSHD